MNAAGAHGPDLAGFAGGTASLARRGAWLLPAAIMGLGVLARLSQYLANRSLWLDEAYLALNVLGRDPAGLLRPLDDNQIAPPGFLWAVKAATLALGSDERALRLVPLAGGVLAVLFTWTVARRALGRDAALLATAITAWSQPLIYYSSELKPYATDALAALAAYALCLPSVIDSGTVARAPSARRVAALGVAGALLPWLSYPATFVLAGCAAAMLWTPLVRRRRRDLALLSLPPALWCASLLALYAAVLRHGLANEFLRSFWRDFFAPFPPRSLVEAYWFPQSWFDFLVFAAGLPFYGLATLAWLVGAWALWRAGRGGLLAALLLPPALATVASMLQLYPLYIRVLLFAVPPAVLLIAAGARELCSMLAGSSRVVAALVAALLLFHPLYRSLTVLAAPPWSTEEPRPTMEHMVDHWQDGDRVYVYHGAEPTFTFYAHRLGLGESAPRLIGEPSNGDFSLLDEDIRRMLGGRAWFVFAHVSSFDGINEQSYMLRRLDGSWPRLDQAEARGAGAYLYDLSP